MSIVGPALTAIELGSLWGSDKFSGDEKIARTTASAGSAAAFSAGLAIGAAVGGPFAFITGPVGGFIAMFNAEGIISEVLDMKLKVYYNDHNKLESANPRMVWKNVPDLTVAYLVWMEIEGSLYWVRVIKSKSVRKISDSSTGNDILPYLGVPDGK